MLQKPLQTRKRFLQAGFDERQADSLVEALEQSGEHLATNEDLERLHRKIVSDVDERMDRRFSAMNEQVNQRFGAMNEKMDRRFDEMNARFDAVNGRFDEMNAQFNERLDNMGAQFNGRLDSIGARFDDRLDRMHEQMRVMMRWTVGAIIAVGTIISVLLSIAEFA